MPNLINVNIPHSVMGPGAVNQLGDIVKNYTPAKILVVTDAGVLAAGLLEPVKAALGKSGFNFDVFSDCQPEAPISVIDRLVKQIKDREYGLLIGIGGGSTMDTTKIASIIARSDLKALDLRSGRQAEDVVPKILIPTTAGTGSEWSNAAVVTNDIMTESGQTTVIVTPQNFANAAIVDPELTYNLPQRITADTGMDALTHAIEAYTSQAANVMSDMFAETAIRLIAANLRTAYAKGSRNIEARCNMSIAASLAMHAVVFASVGLAHFMNEPLGKKAQLSHGATCILLLPAVMEFNLIANPAKYARVAEFMGENVNGLSCTDAAAKSIAAVKRLAKDIDMPTRANVEITDTVINNMVAELFAMEGPVIKLFNPREVSQADAARIYYKILKD